MKTSYLDQRESYKFLGVEQVDGIKTNRVSEKVKRKGKRRMKLPRKSELTGIYRQREDECNLWLKQKISPEKAVSAMLMFQKMVKKRSWKTIRSLIEN